jgi:hypothetical protein
LRISDFTQLWTDLQCKSFQFNVVCELIPSHIRGDHFPVQSDQSQDSVETVAFSKMPKMAKISSIREMIVRMKSLFRFPQKFERLLNEFESDPSKWETMKK